MEPVCAYTSKYRLMRSGDDVPSAKINVPNAATKVSLPRAATLLETVAEDEEDARFESTTVTEAPASAYKAPPLLRVLPFFAELVAQLHMTRNMVEEAV